MVLLVPAAVRHLLPGPVAGGVEVHAGEAAPAPAGTKSKSLHGRKI